MYVTQYGDKSPSFTPGKKGPPPRSHALAREAVEGRKEGRQLQHDATCKDQRSDHYGSRHNCPRIVNGLCHRIDTSSDRASMKTAAAPGPKTGNKGHLRHSLNFLSPGHVVISGKLEC